MNGQDRPQDATERRLKALMLRGLDGDAGAHRELLAELAATLRPFFARRLGDRGAEADDLVQEVLLAVHTRRATFDRSQPFTAWAYAIARYKLVDFQRRRGVWLATPMFWIKIAYPLAVAGAAMALACRLTRPARGSRNLWLVALAPFVLIVAAGAFSLVVAPPPVRMAGWLGVSWAACPLRIAALGAPALAASVFAYRSLAPIHLRSAGFAAGLAAGGVGAAVYALSCPETGLAFLATWHSLGMLAVASVGALIGPRVLRW